MKEENKNLEDFLKGRINRLDASSDADWDRPDPLVWKVASQQFPNYPISKKRRPFLWLFVLLSLLLGAYTFYLHNKTANAVAYASTTETKLETAQSQIESLKKEQELIIDQLKKENESAASTIDDLNARHQNTITQVQQQQTVIQRLNTKNESLIDELTSVNSMLTSVNHLYEQKSKAGIGVKEGVPVQWNQALAKQMKLAALSYGFTDHPTKYRSKGFIAFPPPLIQKAPRFRTFEVGANVGFQNVDVPVSRSFVNLTEIDEVSTLSTWMKGIHFAYQIRPNFFIRTGFQEGTTVQKEFHKEAVLYDKSGEYLDDAGKTVNDLQLNISSPYSATQNAMTVQLPEDAPDNGDVLLFEYYDVQKYNTVRIPLGLDYYLGKGPLRFLLQGGAAWNKLFIGDYVFDGSVSYQDKELALKKVKVLDQQEFQTNFMSTYLGGGVDFSFAKYWHARASYSFENQFLKTNESLKDGPTKFNTQRLEMGVYFRF